MRIQKQIIDRKNVLFILRHIIVFFIFFKLKQTDITDISDPGDTCKKLPTTALEL